jgi:hypothetical protein
MDKKTIVIVSGLPRSGTSLMMQILEAGGISVLKDDIRSPDEDNPKGYYEFERVKKIEEDQSWLKNAQGRAVKIVSALLKYLPKNYSYRIIFMRRDLDEILASQKQMLINRKKEGKKKREKEMMDPFKRHLREVKSWLEKQRNIKVIYINYNELIKNPIKQVEKVNRFLRETLKIEEMVKAVEPKLYRQRRFK